MESRHKRDLLARSVGLVSGLPVPLFDRFDEELDDGRTMEPYRIHTLSLLLESIQKEIENLLNTRLPPRRFAGSSWEPLSLPQTVLDYGLPDFSSLSAGSPFDTAKVASAVSAKIAAFEPRLQNPVLELQPAPDDPARMIGTLRGTVRMEQVNHPVSFPVSFGQHDGPALGAGEAIR